MEHYLTSVQKCCTLLKLFLRGGKEWGVTDLSRELTWSKGAVHKMLSTLESEGFIKQNPRNKLYSLGYTLLELGNKVKNDDDVVGFARPYLQQLADATKESVCLCIRDHMDAIYVDKLDSPLPIRFIIDGYRRFPLYATSASRVILAYGPEALQEAVLNVPMTAFTSHSITEPEQLRLRLEHIRSQGYEISSNMRNIGVTGIAAPIFQSDGSVLASISLIGPSERMEQHVDRWLALVLQTTQEMSRLNGFL
ncbi:IclR family transcriptional regulator [Paenibacillus thiaminolyticus]|uniref:IclR family transcriptional regulator n=1 Tax=Paenibacillus thiaminolyticus TaxID=49283 RepID=UPI0023311429|nr:IclR family transcriptional regulator [Paenibacillus thiaminolyticus]WCF09897.1 IclR family transcriptional regulator [Paenibacillus thiaminolyticus]